MSISDKLNYLVETKKQFKNALGEDSNVFRNYIKKINFMQTILQKSMANQVEGQAEGESITIDDSSDLPIKNVQLGGKMEQETSTTGKNYFTGNKIKDGTTHGITYSFNNSILKLNGTVTTAGNIINDAPTKVKLPAGIYTYSIKANSGTYEKTSGDFAFYLMKSPNTFITGSPANSGITGNQLADTFHSMTFTIEEDTDLYLRFYSSNKDIVFNNLELYIQIESGSSYTEFEQFIPNMPSIDYPSSIKCVSGENEFGIINNNFLKIPDNSAISGQGLTNTIKNGEITINGTSTSNWCNLTERIKNKIKAGTYTFSRDNTSYNTTLRCYRANGTYVDAFITSGNAKTITFKEDIVEYYIFIYGFTANTVFSNFKIKLQLEKGSTATEYVEHQEQVYPINLGNIELYEDGYISIDYEEKAGYKTVTKASVTNVFEKVYGKDLTWSKNTITIQENSYYQFYAKIAQFEKQSTVPDGVGKFYSNTFYLSDFTNENKIKGNFFYFSNTNLVVCIAPKNESYITDINTFNESIADTYFVGKLTTPTVTEITDSTLLAQLEALINAETYRNITHVDTETENLKPNVKITYRKDLSTLLSKAGVM